MKCRQSLKVSHGHDRDEGRRRLDGALQLLEVNEAVLLDREVGDLEAFGLQLPAGVEDALVLRLGRHDVVFLGLVEPTKGQY